jgi:choline dehydrogenase-like flavoprotein
MIISANHPSIAAELRADLCIVGAGAAGIALALELADSGLDVVLLESGGLEEDPRTQDLYRGTVADEALHSPPDRYRQRRLGGSTTTWGGRCMPFDPIDFEPRDYIAGSGWPFSREALDPYYDRANPLCEAGPFVYSARQAFQRPLRPVIDGFSSPQFSTDGLERFSCPTDFGARYRHRLEKAPNLRLLLDANATHIGLDASGRHVDRLIVRTLAGRELKVRAQRYVLATGGLEVVRLLLASRDHDPRGIGNEFDQVGRYYMCHLAGTIGTLRIRGTSDQVHHGYDVSDEGVYCRRRLSLEPAVQRKLGLGNFIARLHHPRITDPDHRSAVLSLLFLAKPLIPYEYAKRLHGDAKFSWLTRLRHVGNVVARPFDAVAFAWHMLRDRKLAARKFPSIIIKSRGNLYSVDFHAEQVPNPDSRVTLNPESRDELGMPRLHIDWRYTPQDVKTVQRALALLAEDIASSGVGTFEYSPDEVEQEMTRYGAYGGHHIGTTRMGLDPRTSVVNPDCRVHSVDNLYIASSAVFPTSSQANPTLTIVAMALRLGAHLKAGGHA